MSSIKVYDGFATSAAEINPILLEAIEKSRNGIVICDVRLKDQPLIYVNAAFENLTGYSREECLGKNCRFLQGNETDQDGVKLLRGAVRKQIYCKVTLKNFRKNGTTFWNEISLSPVKGEDGRLKYYIGVQTDVTAQFESESEIQKLNETLKERNRKLRKTIRELTRARISKKAITYVFLFAIILFLFCEEFLDPFIENHSHGEYIDLALKCLIALALKPLETFVEGILTKRHFIRKSETPELNEVA